MLRRFEFDYDFINKGRLVLEPSVFENINKNNLESRNRLLKSQSEDNSMLRKGSYVLPNTLHCNKDWPLCIYDITYKNKIVLFFIISIGEAPNFIEDYFFKKTHHNRGMVELSHYNFLTKEEETENKDEHKYIPFKKLIIERRVHKCQEEKNELEHTEKDDCKDNKKHLKSSMFEKLERDVNKLNSTHEEIEDIIDNIENKSNLNHYHIYNNFSDNSLFVEKSDINIGFNDGEEEEEEFLEKEREKRYSTWMSNFRYQSKFYYLLIIN